MLDYGSGQSKFHFAGQFYPLKSVQIEKRNTS